MSIKSDEDLVNLIEEYDRAASSTNMKIRAFLSLYNSSTGRCFWKYDVVPEVLSCIRRDPFDSRHFCVIRIDSTELLKLERDMAGGVSRNSSSASAVFPTYAVRFAFSLQWRYIIFVTFPRELVVFDLQYETPLFSATLPGGCGKFLDVLPDPNYEFLYCAHLDGKLSTWRRKEGGQVHIMCSMEELMPSIGTSVPSLLVLALVISQSDSTLQNIGKLHVDVPHPPSPLSSPPSTGPRSLSAAVSSPLSPPAPTSSSPQATARAVSPSLISA
ncbi:hypothetical protein ACFX1Z_018697 [Malus domestica]